MPGSPRLAEPAVEKHRRAITNTLSWADESAADGRYADAIAWLDVITAIGDELPDPYPAKRAAWQSAIADLSASESVG